MSGYDEAFGKTEAIEPAPAEAPAAAEVVTEAPSEPSEPAPTSEPAPQPAPSIAEPQDHSIPLNVLLRTREEFGGKLTQAEQRALRAERELAEFRRREQEATAQMPHPLDAPEEFASWLLKRQSEAVNKAVADVRSTHSRDREELSRVMVEQHLGPEKFGELKRFIDSAPDEAHAVALRQAHPYGWFMQQFNRAQEQRKAHEALKALQGKSLEERIAEAVAAERAKWESERATQAQPDPQTQADRARNPDGTFATAPQTQQRHQPLSLAAVNGAPAPRGGEVRSGYDAAFRK